MELEKQFNEKFCMSSDGAEDTQYLFRINPDGSLSIALMEDVEAFIKELLTKEFRLLQRIIEGRIDKQYEQRY